MEIKNITVAGGGVLGSQIALQSAYKGFSVTMWLRSEGSIERAKPKLERLRTIYKQTLEAMKTDPTAYCRGLADSPDVSAATIDELIGNVDRAFDDITLTTDLQEAFGDTDLVIEAIAEIIDETLGKGGNVVIPSFAVGRTQELLYFIREIKDKGLVKSNPDFPVYIDSPLARRATTIFTGDLDGYLDADALALVQDLSLIHI